MLERVDRVLLRVPTLAAGVSYYGQTLGLRLLRRERHAAAFALGEAELVVHDSPDLPAMEVSFRVRELSRLYEQRQRLGLKFATPPRRGTRGLRACVRDAFGHVLQLVEVDEARADAAEHGSPTGDGFAERLFGATASQPQPRSDLLTALYAKAGRTADDLPYTHHFEMIYDGYSAAFERPPSRAEVWRHLLRLRKAGKLPPMGRSRSRPPTLTPEQRQVLRELLGQALGRRDRLPYTPELETLRETYTRRCGQILSPHQFWRVVATLAK